MNTPTDKKGYPIQEGDLLRSFHFRGGRNRRNYYLYHVAKIISGDLTAVPYDELVTGKDDGGRINFRIFPMYSGHFEIIAGGDHVTLFDERKKVKP